MTLNQLQFKMLYFFGHLERAETSCKHDIQYRHFLGHVENMLANSYLFTYLLGEF